jgi:hypothetical protein
MSSAGGSVGLGAEGEKLLWRIEENACELYICCTLLSCGYALCLVATVQFIKLGSNTDQRTELLVTNNNMDDNTAVNKIIYLHNKMPSLDQTIYQ